MKTDYQKPVIKEYLVQMEGALLNPSGEKQDYGEAEEGEWD